MIHNSWIYKFYTRVLSLSEKKERRKIEVLRCIKFEQNIQNHVLQY